MTLRLAPLSVLLACICGFPDFAQEPSAEGDAGVVVKRLWSADDHERASAKREIRRFGQKAVPALIDLLREVLSREKPHFAAGKEAQGHAAWISLRYQQDRKARERALLEFRDADVSETVARDAGNLLGHLRSEEALRLLAGYLLSDDDHSGTKRYWHPAMYALVEMGSFAVPELIKAIETSPLRAASQKYAEGLGPSDLAIAWDTRTIQTRAAMVLGEIGDASALPVLTGLECKAGSVDCSYIREAISLISERTR